MNKYLLTVIIPMYNSAEYLNKTLSNVSGVLKNFLNQVQVILVDDGSDDNTQEIAKQFCNKYDSFQLILQHHNGVSAARNLGIKSAQGQYITFIDSDDEITSEFSKIVTQLKLNKFDIVMSNLLNNFEKSDLSLQDKISIFKIINGKSGGESPWAKFYKKSFLDDNDLLFNSKIIIGEDALFLYQAVTVATSVNINTLGYYKQCAPHTIGKFKKEMHNSELLFIKELEIVFSKYKECTNYNDVIDIENRYRLKEFYRLIENYFIPLYLLNKESISGIVNQLKSLSGKWDVVKAAYKNPYSKLYWHKRQKFWGFLVRTHNYYLLVYTAILFKKMNKY